MTVERSITLKEFSMEKFVFSDFETIKNDITPSMMIKRKIKEMLESSCRCSAIVENVEKDTGKYRIILEGQLGDEKNFDSSYYLG